MNITFSILTEVGKKWDNDESAIQTAERKRPISICIVKWKGGQEMHSNRLS